MNKRPFIAAVLLVVTALLFSGGAAMAGEKIALLISSNDAPYKAAVSGFSNYLAKQGIQAGYEVFTLDGDAAKAGPAIQKIRASGCRLIFSLGSLATDAVVSEVEDIPIVACLVLRTDSLKNAPNATGVGLEFSFEAQLEWLQRFLPRARSIGVLYNPEENQKRVEQAARLAKKAGLRLDAQEVRTPQDVPAALNNLSKQADVLWGMVDSLTLSPTIGKNVLLFSFRNNIPYIGPSATWVKAGALYSLDWDYEDLGAQCGEMAQKILGGTEAAAIPPLSPRRVLYTLNLFTARQMKIPLSEELVRGAHLTY
jgi:putative tryptophan/tyrosine transport system substrate-binding protein